MIRTRNLLLVNGVIWLAIGLRILLTGLGAYQRLWPDSRMPWWWVISLVIFAGFFLMFRKVVARYSARILAFTEPRKSILHTFSLKGYLLIAFMIGLGITFRHLPGITDVFFATFYTGLGAGLISAGIRFLLCWKKQK